MNRQIFNIYKIPLLLSITIFIVLIALRLEREPIAIALIFIGAMGGTFFLDLDYFFYTYVLEPNTEFSKMMAGYIKHMDITGGLTYVHFHKKELKEKILNSALFQIILGGLMIFVTSSNSSLLIKALIVSAFVNSMYKMFEEYFEGNIEDWFWAIKIKMDKGVFYIYTIILLLVLLFSINRF